MKFFWETKQTRDAHPRSRQPQILAGLSIVASVVAGSLGWAPVVKAQETNQFFDISISPPVTYLPAMPGQTVSYEITLENHSPLNASLTPKWVDFSPSQSGTGIDLASESSFPFKPESGPMVETIVLKPGEKKTLTTQFKIPSSAPGYEYHQTILFTSQTAFVSNESTQPTQTQVSGSLGTNLILTVLTQPPQPPMLELEKTTMPRWVDSFRPLHFTLQAKNANFQAGVASGSAELLNWQGKKVMSWEFYPDRILAKSTRQIRSRASMTTPAGETEVSAEPTFTYRPGFWIGPYQLKIFLSPDGISNPTLVTQSLILVVPVSVVGSLTLIGVAYGVFKLKTAKFPLGNPGQKF